MNLVFMGTPEFAVPSLERLAESGYLPVAVVTAPDLPRGRGQKVSPTPVKEAALRLGIQRILQPASVRDPEFAAELGAIEPDVIVVVAFRILPPEVYELASMGTFNLHGSLLPRYRGAAPIHRAVMAGERETGVTAFFLKQQVDTGDVILRRRMEIGPEETTGEVHDRMMILGAEAVVETVRLIEAGEVKPQPQEDAAATPAPKIYRDDCRIPWDRPSADVHNHIRGLSPYPGAWTTHSGSQLKIFRSRAVGEASGAAPGTTLQASGRLMIACGEGAVEILELQQEGRQRLPADRFLLGYDLKAGDILGS